MWPTAKQTLKIAFVALLLLYAYSLAADILRRESDVQWDFRTYYYAALAWHQDLDPYSTASLGKAAEGSVPRPFIYPPYTLGLFRPFNVVPFSTAFRIWLALKLILLAGMIFLWRKIFLPEERSVFFYLFVFLAFDTTIYWDFKAGNISVVEQFFLWTAFLCLLKRKPVGFCLLLLAASAFKLIPIFFLVLLPLGDIKHKWRYFWGTGALYVLLLTTTWLASPVLSRNYLTQTLAVKEYAADFNYAIPALLQDLHLSLNDKGIGPLPDSAPLIAFMIIAGVILVITARAYLARKRELGGGDNLLLICLACVVYALVAPRMKCYSHVILIVPAYYIMNKFTSVRAFPFIFLLLCLPVYMPVPDGYLIVQYGKYFLLYMNVAIWLMFIGYLQKRPGVAASSVPQLP